jgi:hypothetical protein
VELKELEESLAQIYDSEGSGFISMESKEILVGLESRRRVLLKEKEEVCSLKSRVVWLASGHENIKFFQALSKVRCMKNTIWRLDSANGVKETSF